MLTTRKIFNLFENFFAIIGLLYFCGAVFAGYKKQSILMQKVQQHGFVKRVI